MLVTSADVASLDASLNWWEWTEYIAESFVILACVGEFISEFTHVKTPDWRHRLSRLSLLILIVGLAVELGALVGTNGLAGQEIALLNGVAAEARTRAANAEATSKGFDARIAEAQRGTAEAERQTETLKRSNLELQSALLRLQRESEPRRLKGEQRGTLIRLLMGTHSAIAVVSKLLDTESSDFADDLASVLRDGARWETLRIDNRVSSRYGVSLGTVAGTPFNREATVLDHALTAIGIAHDRPTFADGVPPPIHTSNPGCFRW